MMNQQLEKKNSKTSLRLHYLMLQRLLPVVCSDCLHIFLIKMFSFRGHYNCYFFADLDDRPLQPK